MDLMARRAGASSSSTRRNRADRAASRVPAAAPSRKPAVMRTREYPMALQNSSVGINSVSRASTRRGETRMMRWLMTMVPACHRSSQKSTAQARMVRRPFMEVSG